MSPAIYRLGVGGSPPADVSPILDVDFDGFADTAAMMAADASAPWDDVETVNPGLGTGANGSGGEITLEDAPSGGGHTKAMRYRYNHGTGNGVNSITLERKLDFPTPLTTVWAEFLFRYSTNFSWSNAVAPPNDHKLIQGDTEAGGNGRWMFYIGADSAPTHSLQIETPYRVVGSAYEDGTGLIGAYYPTEGQIVTPEALAASDTWHTYRIYINSPRSGAALKVWIDEELLHDESGFGIGGDGGVGSDRVTGFSFCHNKDDGPANVTMDLYWGHIRIWDAQPSWAA